MATYPVVFFYAENTREAISLLEVIVTLAMFLTATLLLLMLLRLLIKDSTKVAVIVSVFHSVFFAYGAVHALLLSKSSISVVGGLIGEHRFLLPIAAAMVLAAVPFVLRSRWNLALPVQIGTATILVLVIFNLGRIGYDTVRDPYERYVNAQVSSTSSHSWPEADTLPDIYYIVLDAYGRADVLNETYKFDNRDFLDSLTRKGFYVAPESRTNYVHTGQSLAASLNMRYLTEKEDPGWAVKENAVLGVVKSIGYQYVHLSSGWAITKRSKHADVEIFRDASFQVPLNDFFLGVLRHTIALPLSEAFGQNLESPFAANYRTRFNNNMKTLQEIPDIPGPTFTFNHNLPPHPPFIFDRDGNLPGKSRLEFDGAVWRDADLYIDQIRYVNKMVVAAVDGILKHSPREPVIIIQGDHGPGVGRKSSFDNPSDRFLFDRTAIFNAYYLPEHCRSGPYPTITPVNTFRMVFDSCLGADFGLLPDDSYWARNEPPIDFPQSQQ